MSIDRGMDKEDVYRYLSIDSGVSQSYKKTESFSFLFFGISGWDIDLDYCDVEWFALKMK